MKAAAFEYIRPRDLGEVSTALQGDHTMAKLVAGGQSLLPKMSAAATCTLATRAWLSCGVSPA